MIIALQTLVFFRETLMTAFMRIFQPYYKRVTLAFTRNDEQSEDDEPDEQVFAQFDDEKGVIFFPPVYAQRYAAVSDCLMDERWRGRIEKVVDFGYHDMSFIKYLKEVPGIQCILGVDLESIPLRCSSELFGCDDYTPRRESPLQVTLFQGNAADPDYRLIGCDAVIAIELIEHMLPHDLDRLVHTVFGFIKPWIVIFTTPNGDFNVLFKALGKNGFRRWDHFFEWSREQFHDWCSNIVVRYPLYTVTSQGIGPGPPGTLHHGCCSQLVLFINKNYHKQEDLNLNSLALVQTLPNQKPLQDLIECWDSPDNSLLPDVNDFPTSSSRIKSLSELYTDNQVSGVALMISPSLSISTPYFSIQTDVKETHTQSDKTSQCNLDSEFGKSFLMFDGEQCINIMAPRRSVNNTVYEIEDVASRLNCSTLQVKKFSKITQNLMAKYKTDSLVHTRRVVDEIRYLTKTLNINRSNINQPGNDKSIWCNFNWGDNAPYWNQYYKIVKEYNYPFEVKSDECRILELISDEINRMIDAGFDEEQSCVVNRMEIPINHLMTVVEHITDDVDRVRDLLEWNGYEIVDDVVIHSRLVMDSASTATLNEDSQDNDTNCSDWDNVTEVRSVTISETSTVVQDYQDRSLRRALDHKLRNLRTMLTADEDITTELDKVVCKLMKLALRTSKGQNNPPPTKWMQCKLLDLLTLTEKSIERRKKHFIENSFKAIEFGYSDDKRLKVANINKILEDNIANEMVKKYRNIISSTDTSVKTAINEPECQCNGTEPVDDFMNTVSDELLVKLNKEYIYTWCSGTALPLMICTTADLESPKPQKAERIERTKAWLNVEINASNYFYDNTSSEDTDGMANVRHKQKRSKHMTLSNDEVPAVCTITPSKALFNKHKSKNKDKKKKSSSTRITKKVARRISGQYNIVKKFSSKNAVVEQHCIVRSKRRPKENRCLTIRATKPIPESIIDLCHQELKGEKRLKEFDALSNVNNFNATVIPYYSNPIVATEEDKLLDITMNDTQDCTDLHRSIGTDAEAENVDSFDKNRIENLSNDIDINLFTRHEVSMENIYSQTIFLNDINEPSTSKGIRHNIGMDVQCGPDTLAAYPMISASTSLIRNPPVFSTGIKIHDAITDPEVHGIDSGTTTQDNGNDKLMTPRTRSVGIKIKDSGINISTALENFTTTQNLSVSRNQSPLRQNGRCSPIKRNSGSKSPEPNTIIPECGIDTNANDLSFRTELIKPIKSHLKTGDWGSKFCMSVCTLPKSTSPFANISKNTNEIILLNTSEYKEGREIEKITNLKCSKPKLCCGGIHVHSYKDKQVTEDVIYQGEWQRYRVKPIRKTLPNTILAKKLNESGCRKQKDTPKEKRVNPIAKIPPEIQEKTKAKVPRNLLQVPNPRMPKPIPKPKSNEVRNKSNKSNSNKPKPVHEIANTQRQPKSVTNVVKVASKITMNSKHVKSAFTAKKPQITANITVKQENNSQIVKRSYIPLYMRRKNATRISDNNSLNKSLDSANTDVQLKKGTVKKKYPSLVRSKTEEIRKELLNFHDKLTKNTYLVFRNEQQACNSSTNERNTANITSSNDNTIENDSYVTREVSSHSLNSSTCSTPNSIATVRTNAVTTKSRNLSYRRHSASSHKNSVNTSESENGTPNKPKKVPMKCKNAKRSNIKDTNNMENIPQATENFAIKETDKFVKSSFVRQHKSVCIAQLKTDRTTMLTTTHSLVKHKVSNKSNVKIPTPENTVEKKRSLDNMDVLIKTVKSESLSANADIVSNQGTSYGSSECGNMVLVVEPQELLTMQQNITITDSIVNTVENSLLTEWKQDSHVDSESTNIRHYMSHLIEELLDVIDFVDIIDSSLMSLSLEGTQPRMVTNESICSFKTVTADHLNNTYGNPLNRTFDSVLGDESTLSLSGTGLTVPDLDLLSFKSVTSVSKPSEYFLANSELITSIPSVEQIQTSAMVFNPTSVTDIFERKDMRLMQNQAGVIANQAFSGFSLNGEPVTGDQPDPISLIDSETGSLAMGATRQATSEELYISGRSSESYQSCLIDEDVVVPNWLFRMMSQQHSVAESQLLVGPQPAPLAEPMYDGNGNVLDTSLLGVAAGAGDGRGIHSDQSQDSSGRGTSQSSSDTSSSSAPSEAILVDPSGFTTQFDLMLDPTVSSSRGYVDVASARDDHSRNTEDADTTDHSRRRPRIHVNAVSDIDADISSLDTDVPDSSDY